MIPELESATEAEEFFEALGVAFDPAVLGAHRLAILKVFGLAAESWLAVNPAADAAARRSALARALREAHAALADDGAAACGVFGAPRLVTIGRGR